MRMFNYQFKFYAKASGVQRREDMSIKTEATIEYLYELPDNCKAEIVNGKLMLMSPTGFFPGRAGGKIYASLRDYERLTKSGYALPDNVGFIVNSSASLTVDPERLVPTCAEHLDFARWNRSRGSDLYAR